MALALDGLEGRYRPVVPVVAVLDRGVVLATLCSDRTPFGNRARKVEPGWSMASWDLEGVSGLPL